MQGWSKDKTSRQLDDYIPYHDTPEQIAMCLSCEKTARQCDICSSRGYMADPLPRLDASMFNKLYEAGMSDRKIGVLMGVTLQTVYRHRTENELPPNCPQGRKRKN